MRDRHLEIIKSHVAQLAEHFDTVQIFCTLKREDETVSIFDGSGNWFARFGQIRVWIIAEEKDMTTQNRKESIEDDDNT